MCINRRKSKYTHELLSPLVAVSRSWSDLLRRLGLKQSGGNHRNVKSHVQRLRLNTDHFKGQGWAKGLTADMDVSVERVRDQNAYPKEAVLVKNGSTVPSSKRLRKLMLESGILYECENGHPPTWMGESLTLHVDHINGDHTDNRIENLRFLCPNCHQQTHTWGNKK